MRISDWSSDVCSSDLPTGARSALAAFIEVGLERTAFLHVNDMVATPTNGGATPSITQLLHDGQSVLVQVVKDPLGSKGARLTTLLSIPSRYLVLLSHEPHVGVSARLEIGRASCRGRVCQDV